MLARDHRVTRGDDYRLVTRSGARAGDRGLSVSLRRRCDARTPTRFGFIIPKRVGVAVIRNLIRRRLKAISAESLSRLPSGLDIVYRVAPEVRHWDFSVMRSSANRSIDRALRRLERQEPGS